MALLNKVGKGNITSATLTKVKIDGQDKLKVLLRTDNPATGVVIMHAGILTRVRPTLLGGFGVH
jgi:hypothetical protein